VENVKLKIYCGTPSHHTYSLASNKYSVIGHKHLAPNNKNHGIVSVDNFDGVEWKLLSLKCIVVPSHQRRSGWLSG
jgi:hypothetical protein